MSDARGRPSPPLPPAELARALDRFRELRVLVVGDLFLDEYIEGEMYEISKEGPIPVVRNDGSTRTAGAAGNLAASIRDLGAQVSIVAAIGDDAHGAALRSELDAKGIDTSGVIVEAGFRTLTYSKIRARVENAPSREILRLDILPDRPLSATAEERLLATVRSRIAAVDGVIVLDQIHHLITPRLLAELPEWARTHETFLQGSSRDHLASFRGFDLVIPNDREALSALAALGGWDIDTEDFEALGGALRTRGGHRRVLLTLGSRGMALFAESTEARGPFHSLPTYADDVVDVTGAGDAVSAAAILGSLLGWDLSTVAWTASQSAAIALAHAGTHHVRRDELATAILRH